MREKGNRREVEENMKQKGEGWWKGFVFDFLDNYFYVF